MGVADKLSLAGRIVGLQIALGALCSVGFFIVDVGEGSAALLAMMSTVLPSGYYAWVQGRTFNATRLLLHGVYKVVATMTFMGVSFAVFEARPMGFFVTFALCQTSYFWGLGMQSGRK